MSPAVTVSTTGAVTLFTSGAGSVTDGVLTVGAGSGVGVGVGVGVSSGTGTEAGSGAGATLVSTVTSPKAKTGAVFIKSMPIASAVDTIFDNIFLAIFLLSQVFYCLIHCLAIKELAINVINNRETLLSIV